MKRERFDICWDDSNIEILDWIRELFKDEGYHKHFEIEVISREFDYSEDGKKYYVYK